MLAIEYFRQINYNYKNKNPIYRNLIEQIYVENKNNIFYLSQCLKNDIYIEKIIFSEKLQNIFKLKFKVELDIFHCKKEDCIKNYPFNKIFSNEFPKFFKTKYDLLLTILFKNEIIKNNNVNNKNEYYMNVNFIDNCIFLYDDKINYKLIINDLCIIIIFSKYIVFYVGSEYFIYSDKLCIYSSNNISSIFKLKENEPIIYGFIKKLTNYNIPINKNLPKISENSLLNISYDINNNKICVKERYYDYLNKINLYYESERNVNNEYFKSFLIKIRNSNIYIEKNNCNYIKNKSYIISECTINDKNNGLRFRGKYENRENKNGQNKTTLQKDDIVEYNEEDGNILIDKIRSIKINENEDEYVIGWKAVKNINGEIRILKLGIDSDVKKIKPIDEEYYFTRGKERCEKAIVLDIQLPYKDEEISVVPNEMEAYSYVYGSSNMFKYSVGKEIYPDKFDTDENNSCSNGIHYYRDKNILFEIYIL